MSLTELLHQAVLLAWPDGVDPAHQLARAAAARLLDLEAPRRQGALFKESMSTLGAHLHKTASAQPALKNLLGKVKLKTFFSAPPCTGALIFRTDTVTGDLELDVFGILSQVRAAAATAATAGIYGRRTVQLVRELPLAALQGRAARYRCSADEPPATQQKQRGLEHTAPEPRQNGAISNQGYQEFYTKA